MPEYAMRIAGGVSPGVGVIGSAGGSYWHVYFWDTAQKDWYCCYKVSGVNYGVVIAKASLITLPQPVTTFKSDVKQADLFYGQVFSSESSLQILVGYGYSR